MTTLPQTAPMRVHRAIVPSHPGALGPLHAAVPAQAPGTTQGLTGADIWRVLRANLWLIMIFCMASAVIGYFTNQYLATHYSRYTAPGLLEVRGPSELPSPTGNAVDPNPQSIELAQQTQAQQLVQESLFTDAIQDTDSKIRSTHWFQALMTMKDPLAAARKDLGEHFDAVPLPNSTLIRVTMTCADPNDAKTIVEELGNAHINRLRSRQQAAEQQRVGLLQQEKGNAEDDLSDVTRKLRLKETELGGSEVGIMTGWNGKQYQLDRLTTEQTSIAAQLAGFQSQLNTLVKDLQEGRTPALVEDRISQNSRYNAVLATLDQVDADLDSLTRRLGASNETVIAYKQRRAFYQQKLDETHEELKSTYSENMTTLLRNQIDAASANNGRITDAIRHVSDALGKLNQDMTEYGLLKDRRQELRRKIEKYADESRRITEFNIQSQWAPADWASRPQKPDLPSFPKLPIVMGVAVFIGLALSLGIAFLREMTDQTVRSTRDIARVGQLNLLGIVPHEADDPQAAAGRLPLAILDAPHSMIAEQFRQVRSKLQHAASLDTTRSILVTSPSPGDGKTTVACNLAASLALNGRRILLVDANFRRPNLHAVFGVENAGLGLSEVLNDNELLHQAARETEIPNLSLLTAGARPDNPTELLESQLFIDFVERAYEEYDHVIFDGGPMLVVSDAAALAPRVDGVVTVVRARGSSRGLLMRMRDELRKVRAEHLGVVLNAVRSQGGGYYGRNIKAYYAYQNG